VLLLKADLLKGVDLMNTIKKYWNRIALTLILILSGFLSIFGIWNEGYGNDFYAACVKSMIQSWHNFFFVSLDPGGWVTVDKPPVSLWVQALFAKLLGFHGWSIILPECLAAVASVAIIHHIVKRHFGETAGLISALVLALSPIFIAVSKSNNTDAVLIFFMVLAAWAMMVASDKGQLRYLILSVVLLGVAYNAKTLEAFLILPALYAVYFFATKIKWRTRIWHLAVATVVLLVVSLSWSIIVDLTPASERPYVDNSTTNSELELAIGYNGIQRVTGNTMSGTARKGGNTSRQEFGQAPQNGFGSGNSVNSSASNSNNTSGINSTNSSNRQLPENWEEMLEQRGITLPKDFNMSNFGGGGAGGGASMFSGGGNASILRMFNSTLGGQDSWLLPFALFSVIALLLRMRKSSGADADTRRKLLRNVILWGGSVVTICGYFSIAGFFHPYYISVMAPSLAALVGIGLVEMWKLYKSDGLAGFILPLAMAVTIVTQVVMLTYNSNWAKIMIPLVLVFAGIPTIALCASKLMHKDLSKKVAITFVIIGFVGLLITPAVWSYTPILLGENASMPSAGPQATSGFGGMGGGAGNMMRFGGGGDSTRDFQGGQNRQFDRDGQSGRNNSSRTSGTNNNSTRSKSNNTSGLGAGNSSDTKLISFLVKNNTGEKFLVAVSNASEAEPIILATGKPVMAIGGFSGNDKTLTVAKLEQMVKAGQIKYYLVGGMGGMGGGNSSDDLTAWVKANGKAVDQSQWSNTTSTSSSNGNMGQFNNSETLYDLSSYKTAK
jgi:4-amino-4-deoxy-L-arabinose transferase-like glycosyltransferase